MDATNFTGSKFHSGLLLYPKLTAGINWGSQPLSLGLSTRIYPSPCTRLSLDLWRWTDGVSDSSGWQTLTTSIYSTTILLDLWHVSGIHVYLYLLKRVSRPRNCILLSFVDETCLRYAHQSFHFEAPRSPGSPGGSQFRSSITLSRLITRRGAFAG